MVRAKNQNLLSRILFSIVSLSFFSIFWVSLHDIIEGEEDIVAEAIAAVLSFFGTGFTIFRIKGKKN